MSTPFDISGSFGNPDPDANPTSLGELVTILNALFVLTVTGTYKPYVISSTTPATEDQDKLWLKTDGAGRPLGTFLYYAGHWRRAYTGLHGELRYFSGNPVTYFDGTGLGIVEGEWDGWALANGNNGTSDLSDKFICVGGVYTGGVWKSDISGISLASGGSKDITLTDATTYQPAKAATGLVGKMTASGLGPDASNGLYGSNVSQGTINLVPADAGNITPTAIPTLPPYIVCGLAKWVGFA